MTGTLCSVAICKSSHKKSKQLGGNISFFRFPSNKKLQKEWVRRCYRKDKFEPKNKRICHIHFTEDDFEDSMQARLMNRPARRLKKCAIPSLHLKNSEHVVLSTPRANRMLHKEQKAVVEALLSRPEVEVEDLSLDLNPSISFISENENAYNLLLQKYSAVVEENLKLKKALFVQML